MRPRILAKDLIHQVGKIVRVRGWLNNIREMGKLSFVLLRDSSGLIQIIVEEKSEQKRLKSLQPGSILSVEGTVVTSSAALQVEIVSPSLSIENPIHEAPPIEYYKPEMHADLDFVLDNRSISLRNRTLQAIFHIQAEIVHAYRLYMHDVVGAVEYFPPNILGASSEGGAEFFHVDYFGYTATLAQSSQLYKQIMTGVNERVFALTPFFRAEPSQTTRHLSEGKQFEFEMGFFDHWHEIMEIQENCLKFILQYIQKHAKTSLDILGKNLIQTPTDVPFPRLTFIEAQELYFKRTGIDERKEPDLSPAAERDLCLWAKETHNTDFVFITDWKTEKRPFYSYPSDTDPLLTHTFDLLCAGTEITSGGQRRHTYHSMVEGIKLKGMNPEDFTDYLKIFQYGMPLHGGFGMGLERLTMTLLGLKNIREASLFPSDPKRIAAHRIKANIFFGEENIRNEIIRLCHKNGYAFEHIQHKETLSSEDVAKLRNTRLEEGVKSIILKGKNSKKNYQFNIPAHKRLDMKEIAKITGEKCEFESPEVIFERFGLKVGGIPPFGQLLGLDNYFDLDIKAQEKIAFNCGLLTESILISSKDLEKISDPKWGHFSKAM